MLYKRPCTAKRAWNNDVIDNTANVAHLASRRATSNAAADDDDHDALRPRKHWIPADRQPPFRRERSPSRVYPVASCLLRDRRERSAVARRWRPATRATRRSARRSAAISTPTRRRSSRRSRSSASAWTRPSPTITSSISIMFRRLPCRRRSSTNHSRQRHRPHSSSSSSRRPHPRQPRRDWPNSIISSSSSSSNSSNRWWAWCRSTVDPRTDQTSPNADTSSATRSDAGPIPR